ncbi:type IV secretion system protein, partial [Klebsiella pneumoniae]|uniref:type IV secretion system protein n=1 Tax=Klebsiella pneumoniae TaxID=573 RepID=UPI00211AF35C
KSAQIREILISESAWEEMTCLFAPSLAKDSKESQDLANSIQLKSVMLNTLTTQWEMSVKAAEKRENALEAERVKQWNQQQLNAPTADLNNL